MIDSSANAVLTEKERVIDEISKIYSQEDYGLLSISKIPVVKQYLKRELYQPQRKVIILIVGSHSTGKSSFANWFFGESIQKVSAAIETSKFTFITTGRKRQTLYGPATTHKYDFLDTMKDIPHFLDNLQTEIRLPFKDRSALVTFIDTPGLISDHDRVPYDNELILTELAKHSQLIFVFSDPLTQAFCDPLVSFLHKVHQDSRGKLHFYLTKSDTLNDDEKSRILESIVQKLSASINKCTITVSPFHLPKSYLEKSKSSSNFTKTTEDDEDDEDEQEQHSNCINEICELIEKTVESTVQSNLSQLQIDLNDVTRATEKASVSLNRRSNLFNITTALFVLVFAYTIGSLYIPNLYFYPALFPALLIGFVIWICFWLLKPNKKVLNRIKYFRENKARQANNKIKEFFDEITVNH